MIKKVFGTKAASQYLSDVHKLPRSASLLCIYFMEDLNRYAESQLGKLTFRGTVVQPAAFKGVDFGIISIERLMEGG